ncbi:hypothetical protein [Prauserella rugosa]|uniref:Uncharacterized protein n=1 Tax=Prauserella rugosa TaxID=43354 RepID=A0A660CD68_9PSEU|nr:hypothetical protein [Prauserella rugosa]KMS92774.1 hypothetical protein ACZ91_02555 [Streptomyces regensis]TWH21266.1 hypothetical protein JD82_03123 [Prauserella rugosa]
MAVRLEMTRAGASGTEHDVTEPSLPSPRKPRRFGPGLVARRPSTRSDVGDAAETAGYPLDDRRLTSRYVVRL